MKQSKRCKNQNKVYLAILLSSSGEMVVESCKLTPVCLTILRRVSNPPLELKLNALLRRRMARAPCAFHFVEIFHFVEMQSVIC